MLLWARRTFWLLIGSIGVAACTMGTVARPDAPFAFGGLGGPIAGPIGGAHGRGQSVAILLPLSGPSAAVGDAMLKAAQLAMDVPGSPTLTPFDTAGTPDGAAAAARQAVTGGAGLVLGPLTGAETARAEPIAQQAGIPMLAFTNDTARALPGVWVLGISPRQQVDRLVTAAHARGHDRLGALLPDTEYGHAMADALVAAAAENGLPAPSVQTYGGGFGSINEAARAVSDYANRRGPLDAQIRAAKARGDAQAKRDVAELVRQPIPPAPFDALLLAETGETLAEILSLLPYYDIDRVQLMGPTLWGSDATNVAGERGISGAWFAAPDPAGRAAFEDAFTRKFGASPPRIADVAVDAAMIARSSAQAGGFSAAALTGPRGFPGTDGTIVLQPDGHVRRALALFQIDHGDIHLIEPASGSTGAPGT